MNSIEYRPEIDGLRAVAIVPVILFHLNAKWIPGGFLGVDVFFVISGFLITSILLRELAAGTFSLKRFWARRIRRILPALLVVTAATLAATWILVPLDRDVIARQAVATLSSVANFYFWRHASDYWGPQAEDSPFLHAWSLSVEEQFYLLYPLVVYALYRLAPRRLMIGLAVIVLLSLGLFVLGVQTRPAASFYLLPWRAWELAIGGLLAAWLQCGRFPRVPGRVAGIASGAGLIATVASYMLVPDLSCWAIVPVLGAALVIWFGSHGWVHAFLSHPAVVYVGGISYSLYLWHWPVIVLGGCMRYDVHVGAITLLIALLAMLSYHLIEEPFRRQAATGRIVGGLACMLMVAVFFVVTPPPHIDVSQFDRPESHILYFDVNPHPQISAAWERAFAEVDAPPSIADPDAYRGDGIVTGGGDGPPRVVVVGDSHGAMWAQAIRVAADEAGIKAAFFCLGGEKPFLGRGKNSRRKLTAEEKKEFDNARMSRIEKWKPDVVLVCARWARVNDDTADELLDFLQRHAKRVVIVEQPPELRGVGERGVQQIAAAHGVRPKPGVKQWWPAGNLKAYETGCSLIRASALRHDNCTILPTRDLYSRGNQVLVLDGASLIYLDDDHLSTKGTMLALPRFRELLVSNPGSATDAEGGN